MQLITRKHGSQKTSRPKSVTIEPNWCGQGGSPNIILKTEDNVYLILKPESEEETRQLMSVAHIAYGNYRDPRA